MPRVEFIPSGKFAVVDETTLISEAARRAGVSIVLPCGGKGTCGRCLVTVHEGRVVQYERSSDGAPKNSALACKTAVGVSDCRIEIPEYDLSKDDADDAVTSQSFALSSDEITDPLVFPLSLAVPAAKPDDGLSDVDRATKELKKHVGASDVNWEVDALRALPEALRAENGAVRALMHRTENHVHVCGIKNQSSFKGNYGVAIDLGTTTVSVAIADLKSGNIISATTGYNEQIACGDDVISRINYANTKERLVELRIKAIHTINRLIIRAAKLVGIACEDIFSAVISGNTTMAHLLLGITPEFLRLDPYTPAFFSTAVLRARDLELCINPGSAVYISPAVGSYVGGDITAGILCADFHVRDEVALFIDVGTNGEIVLGNREFLFTCACSAGPAFEGGGISCGMRAVDGAINSIQIDEHTGMPTISVLGGGTPKGICGSGIIDLLSELLLKGWMDRSGKLFRNGRCEAIHIEGRKARYLLTGADVSATGKDLWLTEQDIENVLRAKAAVFSAIATLLEYAALSFGDIDKVYIAGGFGRFLNIHNAIGIGLLPELPVEKFEYLGNASLKGSLMLLASDNFRKLQAATASRMTYVNLSMQSEYTEKYTAALFFPHTDEALFRETIKKVFIR